MQAPAVLDLPTLLLLHDDAHTVQKIIISAALTRHVKAKGEKESKGAKGEKESPKRKPPAAKAERSPKRQKT